MGCLCVHLTFPLPFCLFLRLTTYLPTFPSYYLLVFHTSMFIQSSIRLSACLSDCLCVLLPFHLPFIFSLRLPVIHLPFPLSFCLSLRLPVYLSTLPFPCLLFLRLPFVHLPFPCLPAPIVEGEGVDCILYVYLV